MSDTERIKSLLQGKNILVAEDQVIPAMGLEVKLRYSGVHSIRICDRMAACMSVIDGWPCPQNRQCTWSSNASVLHW